MRKQVSEQYFTQIWDVAGFVFGTMMFFFFLNEDLPEIQNESHHQAMIDIAIMFATCPMGGYLFGGTMRAWMRSVAYK